MKPNRYIETVRAYPLASHKAWEIADKRRVLKLDWNESDVRLPRSVKKAVVDFVMRGPTHWYPDIANRTLLTRIARYAKVPESLVQYFVGEDCALDYVVRTFVSAGDEVVIAAPTYDNFRVFVESVGARPTYVFGKEPFSADPTALRVAISRRTKMVYIVNPNNPTGALFGPEDIERLLRAFPSVLFCVDEAYFEFAGVTVVPFVKKYGNLIVGRSFSKAFGLASFRLGYLVSSPENLAHINKIRNGKSVSALAQIAGIAALKDSSYMKRYVLEVRKVRRYLCRELAAMGLFAIETKGNFILLKTADPHALCAALQKEKIFVRTLGHLPGMEQYIRITVGTMQTAKRFTGVVRRFLKHGKLVTT